MTLEGAAILASCAALVVVGMGTGQYIWYLSEDLRADLREAARLIAARRIRRRHAVDRAHLKAKIIRVGDIAWSNPNTLALGVGWEFDCSNGTPAISVGDDGGRRFCGYTNAELREIHARRSEFNVDA